MADSSSNKKTLRNLPPVVRELERYITKKKILRPIVPEIERFNRKSLLMSIDYVRVNEIDSDGDDGDGIEKKIDVYGTVVASSDHRVHDIVYHRPSPNPESKGLGEYLSLPDPPQDIIATHVLITVYLWAILRKGGNKITKQIARGDTSWHMATRLATGTDTPLEQKVLGRHGSVTVGYSVISKGLSAAINIQMMNESPAQIYGTIKAHRLFEGSSPMPMLMLFDKSAIEWIQVNPKHSMPLTRSFFSVAAPVPTSTDSYLTIEVDLWNHDEGNLMSPDYQIAKGSVQFTPKFGEQMKSITTKNYGEVQLHITFE